MPEDQTSLLAEIERLLAAALQSDLHHLSVMAETREMQAHDMLALADVAIVAAQHRIA